MTRAASPEAAPLADRRTFLGSSVALASAVVASAAVPQPELFQHPDRHLLALGAELDRLELEKRPVLATYNDPEAGAEIEAVYEAVSGAQHEIMKRIADRRASTVAGFAVQARAYAYIYEEDFTSDRAGLGQSTDGRLLWAILSGLITGPHVEIV